MRALESPYALQPSSDVSTLLTLYTSGSSVGLQTMALSRPFKEDRRALPLSTPLSTGRSMV